MGNQESDPTLLDERTYFIGDRITISQVFCLLITGIITFLIENLNLSEIFITYCWWILFIPIISIRIMALKRESLYFNHHWFISFIGFSIIWSSLTVYLGVLIDSYVGFTNALLVSLIIISIGVSGYVFARYLRMIRKRSSFATKFGIVVVIYVLLLMVAMVLSKSIYDYGFNTAGLTMSDSYYEVLANDFCRIGIYIILVALGFLVSSIFSYIMLYYLYDPEGLDVEEDPPNELYVKMMIVSVVLTFISWIFLLVIIPPLGGGGGSGKKGKSRSKIGKMGTSRRTLYYSRYRTYSHYGTKNPRESYPPYDVNQEWNEYDLEKK